MSEREDLLKSLSETIADYRLGEVSPRSSEIIDGWLRQFPREIQQPLLSALDTVLSKTYVSRDRFKAFLRGLASTKRLSPDSDTSDYWKKTNFLNIQQGGGSQREILTMFDDILQEMYGFGVDQTGSSEGDFIYLDDCIGTGSRARSDLCNWLEGNTVQSINLHIITPILYTGSWWIDQRIRAAATANGKVVNLKKWRLDQFQMENQLRHRNISDVLWPATLPNHSAVEHYRAYLEELGHPPILRDSGHPGASGIFEDDVQKLLLEEAFLIRGCEIRQEQTNLPEKLRPLGYSNLDTLGFGSMFVTYRNCPNNTPLVLWVDQDEFPALFPRKTNAETSDVVFAGS